MKLKPILSADAATMEMFNLLYISEDKELGSLHPKALDYHSGESASPAFRSCFGLEATGRFKFGSNIIKEGSYKPLVDIRYI